MSNKRLSRILKDQVGVVNLNRKGWLQRVPFAIRRQIREESYACEICGSVDDGKRLAMDHCHDTGIVRGYLCMSCNTALGHFKDDAALLRKAVAYLERDIPDVEV